MKPNYFDRETLALPPDEASASSEDAEAFELPEDTTPVRSSKLVAEARRARLAREAVMEGEARETIEATDTTPGTGAGRAAEDALRTAGRIAREMPRRARAKREARADKLGPLSNSTASTPEDLANILARTRARITPKGQALADAHTAREAFAKMRSIKKVKGSIGLRRDTVAFHVRLSRDAYDALRLLATEEERTMGWLMRAAIRYTYNITT